LKAVTIGIPPSKRWTCFVNAQVERPNIDAKGFEGVIARPWLS